MTNRQGISGSTAPAANLAVRVAGERGAIAVILSFSPGGHIKYFGPKLGGLELHCKART
jgi:hypothetical protein